MMKRIKDTNGKTLFTFINEKEARAVYLSIQVGMNIFGVTLNKQLWDKLIYDYENEENT